MASRVQLRRSGVPKLLTMVGNRPHATQEDHEASSSSFNDPPVSSSDLDEPDSASIEPSYPLKKEVVKEEMPATTKRVKRGNKADVQPERKSTRRKSTRRKAEDDVKTSDPVKRQKKSDDDEYSVFDGRKDGFQKPKKATRTTYEKKPFHVPTPVLISKPNRAKKEFVNPTSLHSTKLESSSRSVKEMDPFKGAADFVDDIDLAHVKSPKKPKKKLKSSRQDIRIPRSSMKTSQNSPTSSKSLSSQGSASSRGFRKPTTSTQAVRDFEGKDLGELSHSPSPEPEPIERSLNGPCPMGCGGFVPWFVLDELDARPSIPKLQEFCRRHKVNEAEAAWKKNDYPLIDFDGLKKRLKKHFPDIKKMIEKPKGLIFREQMQERVKKGKDRTILQHVENQGLQDIGVGYYGPKGSDIM